MTCFYAVAKQLEDRGPSYLRPASHKARQFCGDASIYSKSTPGRDDHTVPPGRLGTSRTMSDAASTASALLDPVTDEMLSLARQRSHQGRSLVVTSFLVGASNKHTLGPTSFAKLGRKTEWNSETSRNVLETKDKALFRVVDILRARSPALCTPNTTLLVTHDIAGIPSLKDGVRYHYVAPDAASNSMNRRWMILVHILREYTFDCVCAPVPPMAMSTCCRTCAIEPWRRAHAQMP